MPVNRSVLAIYVEYRERGEGVRKGEGQKEKGGRYGKTGRDFSVWERCERKKMHLIKWQAFPGLH